MSLSDAELNQLIARALFEMNGARDADIRRECGPRPLDLESMRRSIARLDAQIYEAMNRREEIEAPLHVDPATVRRQHRKAQQLRPVARPRRRIYRPQQRAKRH